jgi:hypothetical protein
MGGDEVIVYEDWGVSGSAAKTTARPSYQRLKADIAAGHISSVYAESLTRLGRSTRELLTFMDLCREHDVQVHTEKERVDTTTAMGRFLFTIMASIGELELDMGRERSAGSRLARLARHEAAGALLPGGVMPGSSPLYGFVHVRDGDVVRREHDPFRPMAPLVQAYKDAGTVLGAAQLLQQRGVPSPTGGLWASSTLGRTLRGHTGPECDHGIDLPDRNASGRARRTKRPALFAGMLRCYCGRTMTPNLNKRQYYCSAGRDAGVDQHGRYIVTEAALKEALRPEASRQYRPVRPLYDESQDQVIADLQARRERVASARLDGLITATKAKAETDAIDARIERLTSRHGALVDVARDQALDLDGDPVEQNALMRRLWLRVTLDRALAPTVEWVVPPDELRRQDEAAVAEFMGMSAEAVAGLADADFDEFALVVRAGVL